MRNNLISYNEIGFNSSSGTTWDESKSCTKATSSTNTYYGNGHFSNDDNCNWQCWDCSCLPNNWIAFETNPNFQSTVPGSQGFYCLDSTELIDTASLLYAVPTDDPLYDFNDEIPGYFNGNGPDVGGVESGTFYCE